MKELEREAKNPPRPICYDDYKPKKFMLSRKDSLPEWKDNQARKESYH